MAGNYGARQPLLWAYTPVWKIWQAFLNLKFHLMIN